MANNKPINIYTPPGVYGPSDLAIENYRYYCNRIKQFYKKFNMKDDEKYLKYLSLPNREQREDFINNIISEKRNAKIDSLL